ncbi:SDR family oxidoreductase [Spirosoma gilvum]
MNKILVLGGTGVLGSAVVNWLHNKQVDFLIGSRHPVKSESYSLVNQLAADNWKHVDLISGEGLTESLEGVDTVFHLASGNGKIGRESFEAVLTRNLVNAIPTSEVKHLIYSSIVGIDKIPYSYYQAKLESEALIRNSQVRYTILRATQFHNLIDFFIGKLMRYPIGFLPGKLLAQPIHVDAVAHELHQLALAGNQNTILNLGGPQVLDFKTLVRSWMNYQNLSKPILPLPVLGTLMKGFAIGANTCPEKAIGSKTWEDYLQET